jgi:S1-C subfamily serine protease
MPLVLNQGMKTFLIVLLVSFSALSFADGPYSVEASIYKIEVVSGNQRTIGTGVLVAENKILTNCHVVDGGGWPRVIHRKTGVIYTVTQYQQLGKLDACLLTGDFVGVPVPLSAGFSPGQGVWIFGFPGGMPAVGQGTVKGLVDADNSRVLELIAFCAPGSSGGPVVNIKGELIGLNYATFQYQNHCLSIPADNIRPYLRG